MAKTLTIKIKPTDEALEGFRKTFKALEGGQRVARHEGVYFTSIEAARNLLTRNRLALLRTAWTGAWTSRSSPRCSATSRSSAPAGAPSHSLSPEAKRLGANPSTESAAYHRA